jgi:hypothetical protein
MRALAEELRQPGLGVADSIRARNARNIESLRVRGGDQRSLEFGRIGQKSRSA